MDWQKHTCTMELVPASCWGHVVSEDNPTDGASRGVFPSKLLNNDLWMGGPSWLKLPPPKWPRNNLTADMTCEEAEELSTITTCTLAVIKDPLIPVDKFSSFNLYKRIIAWVIRFVHNCKSKVQAVQPRSGPLSTDELSLVANYLYSIIQRTHLPEELKVLAVTKSQKFPTSSRIFPLNPFIDDQGKLRVGGRQRRARFSYNSRYPIILDSRHPLTKLLIHSEHICLLHGGSLLVSSSLFRNFYILGGHMSIRSIVRSCVICRRRSPKTKPQKMGQLPPERITPDMVFNHVGLDFAGPLYLKRSSICKPDIICVHLRINVCKGGSLGACFRSIQRVFPCLYQEICCPKRETFLNMERSWHKFCGCQSSSQGALCLYPLYKNRRSYR